MKTESPVPLPVVKTREPDAPEAWVSIAEPFNWDRLYRAFECCWRRRYLIAAIIFAGALLSLAVALLVPPYYESTARILPPLDSDSGFSMSHLMSQDLQALMTGGFQSSGPAQLYVAMLRSDNLSDRVIKRCSLQSVFHTSNLTRARQRLWHMTEVAEDHKSGTIELVVTSRDKNLAEEIASAFVDELPAFAGEVTSSAVHRERVFLENRLDAAKQNLQDADQQISQFASQQGAINIEQQTRVTLEGAAKVQGDLIVAQTQLRALQAVYAPDNVQVKAAQARIAELTRQLHSLGAAPADDSSEGSDVDFSPSIRTLSTLGPKYVELYRNLKIQEAIYEGLYNQYEIVRLQETQEAPGMKIIDAPEVPDLKAGPSRALICIVGTMLAGLLAFAWVIGGDFWRQLDETDPRKVTTQRVMSLLRSKSKVDESSR